MSAPDDERIVAMFDDLEVLPDVTGDERGAGWGERAAESDPDDLARLLEDRPPHWG